MNNDAGTAEKIDSDSENKISPEQVASYLQKNSEFFVERSDLLADLSLPHESGKAISLVERQVAILRDREIEARQKLKNLLENARNNDQLFDTSRNLVLALLHAENITEIANISQDQLSSHANIDRCEVIIVQQDNLNVSSAIRVESHDKLQQEFADVFRLKRTHCGAITADQTNYLFPDNHNNIHSAALCPAINNGEVLALIAFGNNTENHFNVNLDTLFLDFIGHMVGAVLDKQLLSSAT